MRVKHKTTGAVLLELRGASLQGADLREENLQGAHLRGADLRWAHLEGTNLRGADLRGAHLEGAHLRGADLRGAHLEGAHIEGAHIRGAHLAGSPIIDAGEDSRGYRFIGCLYVGKNIRPDVGPYCLFISAGCRWFTKSEAYEHWLHAHEDNPMLRNECLRKLDMIVMEAKDRGWQL